MEYLTEIFWYASWPVVIVISIKFIQLNIKHYEKIENSKDLTA